MKNLFKRSALLFAFIISATSYFNRVMAQTLVTSPLKQLVTSINDHVENTGFEKIYLQTDKPNYNVGDTLWFKAYILNAAYLIATAKSGILYLEIVGDSNRVAKRIMTPYITD